MTGHKGAPPDRPPNRPLISNQRVSAKYIGPLLATTYLGQLAPKYIGPVSKKYLGQFAITYLLSATYIGPVSKTNIFFQFPIPCVAACSTGGRVPSKRTSNIKKQNERQKGGTGKTTRKGEGRKEKRHEKEKRNDTETARTEKAERENNTKTKVKEKEKVEEVSLRSFSGVRGMRREVSPMRQKRSRHATGGPQTGQFFVCLVVFRGNRYASRRFRTPKKEGSLCPKIEKISRACSTWRSSRFLTCPALQKSL